MLVGIKLLHTVIWALFAGCILAIPVFALRKRFRWAFILSAVVLFECIVLALNGWRCPLTDWAALYTADRAPNFDIYLPRLLAQYNKLIFGTLYAAGEVLLVALWLRASRHGLDRSGDFLRKRIPE